MTDVHTRKLIRDAAEAKLTGLATTGSRVFVGRTRPLAKAHDPTLLIFTPEETSGRPMDGNPASLGRDLDLTIEGRVSAATPPDDLLDQIAIEVETVMRDTPLDGLVFDTLLFRTEIDVVAEGERHIGGIRMKYRVRYNDPSEDE